MKLLLRGGTAFLGRVIASNARDRGIDVTCLARGAVPAAPGVRLVRDRDRDDALDEVADVVWDAVIDLTRQPGHVRRAVRGLEAAHWVLILGQCVRTVRSARAG